ncbi:hypothetical protein SAMN04490178_104106 [Propionispora vibrioides]|uniref:Uncharacterized protein n=1 Tax=Propionispora vibrioides TaxID=112903 RepID=A0A1H8RWY5_9FIRM|nr:hypothetical protein SAMN04490178_104106 [Propionispora vibrioides]
MTGLTVVTELASGLYAVTPLIALLAGAKRVICLGQDTAYGTFNELADDLYKLANSWGLPRPIITDNRFDPVLKGADIVTNLGMVRPLDKQLLSFIGAQAVVPYMCEAWEYREGDVDLEACIQLGIPVMGTDESHSSVGVFQYCGMLAVKMILEAGFEVLGNRIAIVSSDRFGLTIRETLSQNGALVQLFTDVEDYSDIERQSWDVIIVAEYVKRECVLGKTGLISGGRLVKLLKRQPTIVQFAGWNQICELKKYQCRIHPQVELSPLRMAKTLSYLGPYPIVLLHTAGLLVGEKMAQAKKQGMTRSDFNEFVISRSPAQPILTF